MLYIPIDGSNNHDTIPRQIGKKLQNKIFENKWGSFFPFLYT